MNDYIIVSALKEEFPFEDLNVLYTGVGKINATISLLSYIHKNSNIKKVINVGSAASISLQKNSVYECGVFIQGDLNYPGFKQDIITYNLAGYTISTFDSFQTSIPERKCDIVDMESYAFAKICNLNKINFFCFKYISDILGDKTQDSDWIENYHKGRFLLKEKVIQIL
jgi:adenosylhomocysteine nucleosidase